MTSASVPGGQPNFRPLYRQIKALLEESLERGEWHPGEAMPSETHLAQRYGVSQGTVRKAITALASDHLVVRRQGKGTFVATHTEERSSTFRFLRLRRLDGNEDPPTSTLLDIRRSRATTEIGRLLDLKPGDAVIVLRRTLDYDGQPAVLDEITLPALLFKGLSRARLEGFRGSMYALFESVYGVRMLNAEERIRAVAADVVAGRLLRVVVGTPLLAVDRVTFTYGDRPVEVRRGLCSTRRHYYANVLG